MWKLNGVDIPDDVLTGFTPKIQFHWLAIKQVELKHLGNYTCLTEHDYEIRVGEATLLSEG